MKSLIPVCGILLSLSTLPAEADTAQPAASDWPEDLARAVCTGREETECLQELAKCPPGAKDCISGVALCTNSYPGSKTFTFACRTDVLASDQGRAIVVKMPGGGSFYTLFIPDQGTARYNGLPAKRLSDHCIETTRDRHRSCARPLVTEADFSLWRKETGH